MKETYKRFCQSGDAGKGLVTDKKLDEDLKIGGIVSRMNQMERHSYILYKDIEMLEESNHQLSLENDEVYLENEKLKDSIDVLKGCIKHKDNIIDAAMFRVGNLIEKNEHILELLEDLKPLVNNMAGNTLLEDVIDCLKEILE